MEQSTTTPTAGSHADEFPFENTSVCKSAADTAEIIAVIIADKLGQDDKQKQKLVESMTAYFERVDIYNDETFAFMAEGV